VSSSFSSKHHFLYLRETHSQSTLIVAVKDGNVRFEGGFANTVRGFEDFKRQVTSILLVAGKSMLLITRPISLFRISLV
jgi:hypothetical protein